MVLRLDTKKILRLTKARGASIEALEGALWVTEAGFPEDGCVAAGTTYRVRGDGLVLIGADAGADGRGAMLALRTRIRALAHALRAQLEARRTVRELGELSDRALADIGLRREEIPAVGRRVAGL
ncbi:MAG: DUF1127 domain-containing protein [Burkholderiales bacterium]